jgi:hypothetical protein
MNTISPVKIWRNQKKIRSLLGQTGRIESFTIIRIPPAGFESYAPYPVVLVAFRNGKMIGQLADWNGEKIIIGQKVKAVLRKVTNRSKEGVIPYGIKFKTIP